VRDVCSRGCIGCGLCAKLCPSQAIKMENNLPVIDYSLCTGCLTCAKKCPTHVIKVR
jgi:Pyruvate/2-oxoacid:ferredoxin oxidoreductase delta subunit